MISDDTIAPGGGGISYATKSFTVPVQPIDSPSLTPKSAGGDTETVCQDYQTLGWWNCQTTLLASLFFKPVFRQSLQLIRRGDAGTTSHKAASQTASITVMGLVNMLLPSMQALPQWYITYGIYLV